jgi:hypothetical protein
LAKVTLLSAVESGVRDHLPWQSRLPKAAVSELEELRERYQAGTLGPKPFVVARLAIQAAKANGWSMPSEKVIARWLKS